MATQFTFRSGLAPPLACALLRTLHTFYVQCTGYLNHSAYNIYGNDMHIMLIYGCVNRVGKCPRFMGRVQYAREQKESSQKESNKNSWGFGDENSREEKFRSLLAGVQQQMQNRKLV